MRGWISRYYRDRDGRVFERVSPGRYRFVVGDPPRERARCLLQHEIMLLLKDTGLYMRVHACVPEVACSYPDCKSKVGQPCRGPYGIKSTTHTVRRKAYAKRNRE